jgi:hypothetical protein
MVHDRINTPTCYVGEKNAAIYNVPAIQGPVLVIPLWPWLAKLFQWLHIPVVV